MSALHAHLESRSIDCDGPLDRSWVMAQEPGGEQVSPEDQHSEHAFKNRVLASVVSFVPLAGATLNVTYFADDDTSRLSWHEVTDEGNRAVEATFCRDECDTEARSQRDHYAEQMGY